MQEIRSYGSVRGGSGRPGIPTATREKKYRPARFVPSKKPVAQPTVPPTRKGCPTMVGSYFSGRTATSLKNTMSLSLWFCSPMYPSSGRGPRSGSNVNFLAGTG